MVDERASEMLIFQAFKPANIRAVAADHTYSSVTLEEIFLQEEGLITLSAGDRQRIEETTRSQARSSTWLAERGMRLTASNFGRICKVKHVESLPVSLYLEPEDITHIPSFILFMATNMKELPFRS
ncbi:hypothetical protein PoB_003763600 [Plakobranchus ocellatus]|uniref:Uncharacterized protein n=1 Tax=Plakobranchus ocellatus TaxID=259542 RepID=A0AAV4AX77_9GAST|nr:hypothetical protein PoB_003763600 [Plakobranchus ocellatus]